jgi:hypothetical protein
MEKKAKAEAKRVRRKELKENGPIELPEVQDDEEDSAGDEPEVREEAN